MELNICLFELFSRVVDVGHWIMTLKKLPMLGKVEILVYVLYKFIK